MSEIPRKLGERLAVEVDGRTVELERVEIERYDWDHRGNRRPGEPFGHPKHQARLLIWLDGAPVGQAVRPHGWGKQPWGIERLGDQFEYWALGRKELWQPGDWRRTDELRTPEDIARKALKFHGERRLLPLPEMDAELAKHKAREERRKKEEEERQARWRREREERQRREAEKAELAKLRREAEEECLQALRSIEAGHNDPRALAREALEKLDGIGA